MQRNTQHTDTRTDTHTTTTTTTTRTSRSSHLISLLLCLLITCTSASHDVVIDLQRWPGGAAVGTYNGTSVGTPGEGTAHTHVVLPEKYGEEDEDEGDVRCAMCDMDGWCIFCYVRLHVHMHVSDVVMMSLCVACHTRLRDVCLSLVPRQLDIRSDTHT